ncbi:MAG: hypothetical protein HYT75_00935 [Deltaproteobacteria bacterium]|nr:hypothetical protein [Deltaproteobacteria bacterium]
MTTYIREILKSFQPVDSNEDFRIDEAELQHADGKSDISLADANGDKIITLEEYLSFKNSPLEERAVSKIFSKNLLSRFNAELEKCSIADPYEKLFLLSGFIVNREESNYDEGIKNYLKPIAERVPEFGLIGLSESQIVDGAGYYAYRAGEGGMITKAYEALGKLKFNSEDEKKGFLKSIIVEGPFSVTVLAGHLQGAIGAYSGLGLTDAEIKEIIKRDPFALKYAEDMISINAGLKLFDSFELASFVRAALEEKREHLNGLCIFDGRLESAVRYLRERGVGEEDIKIIIKSASRYFAAGQIIDSIPKVAEGLMLAELDPVADLKKYLAAGDVGDSYAGFPFSTFADNVKWLKNISKDKEQLRRIIKVCFFSGKNFNVIPRAFEVAEGIVPEDKRLCWAVQASSYKYDFSEGELKELFGQLKEMNVSSEAKERFADIISLGFPSLRSINSCIKRMRDYKIKDDLIIDTVNGFMGVYGRNKSYYLEDLMSFASRLDVYQNGDEMGMFLDIMYFNKCYLSKAMSGFKLLDDNKLALLKNDPLWPEVVNKFRYYRIVELFGYAYNSGFFDGKITLAEAAADCEWLDDKKVSHWSRYNKDIVKKIKNPVYDQPRAFVSLPGHDHNGAFAAQGVDKIIEKYNLEIAEPYSETELYEALAKEDDNSVDALVLGGHGSAKDFALSESYDNELSKIDVSDEEIKTYLNKVKDGGRIILLGCSTGHELADKIRQWCDEIGKKAEVIAPPVDVASELYIEDDGRINVNYSSNGSKVEGAHFLSTGANQEPLRSPPSGANGEGGI